MRRLWISGAVLLSCILGVGSGWFLWQSEGNTRAPSAGSDVLQDEGVAEMSRYENGKYGFSFSHPASYTVTEMKDTGADIVLIRDAFGNALQVAISPFDEPIATLTPERVRRDLPELVMKDVQEIVIDGMTPALSFIDPGKGLGATREAWFVSAGSLYQLSTYADSPSLLDGVLSSWQFK